MKGLQGERLRQAFRYFDKDQSGFISPKEFQRIIIVRRLVSSSPDLWSANVSLTAPLGPPTLPPTGDRSP